jgi:UDP-N-acetyl-D-glucosamine dehydrogenase
VGREVSLAAHSSGYTVFGIDINDQILQGISEYQTSSSYDSITKANIVIICVPTPADSHQGITDTIDKVFNYISPGSLLIIESTVSIGFTSWIASKYEYRGVQIAYSPERIDPGNTKYTIKNTPKIVAGISTKAKEDAIRFYSSFCSNVVSANKVEEAEAAKLLENSFRLLNISFVNEMSKYLYKEGIDASEVLDLAATKPYGFMRFNPGLGAGGHCIPVDPTFLSSTADVAGAAIRTLDAAIAVNNQMVDFFCDVVKHRLGDLAGKKICVVGISYKPDVPDTRESRAWMLVEALRSYGAIVVWHDDVVREHKGESSQPLTNGYDLVIISNRHKTLNHSLLEGMPTLDTERLS